VCNIDIGLAVGAGHQQNTFFAICFHINARYKGIA
jgi:hypothetical protein